MYLKSLNIFKNGKELRSIQFKKGMNFIVDNTPVEGQTSTGNSIGKTTVLRLVDYCFGSDGTNIWRDNEYKNRETTEIKSFLEEQSVEVELELVDDLDNPKSSHKIRRNFLTHKNKATFLNDEKISVEELKEKLNYILFGIEGKKPHFRYLIAKFIRHNGHRMSNTLRFQFQTFSDTKYEALHLKLLGVDYDPELIAEKGQLTEKIRADENLFKRLTRDFTESALKQALKLIVRDIEKLDTTKKDYKLDGTDEKLIDSLNKVKYKIGVESAKIGDINLKLDIISESVEELKAGASRTDINTLREVYLSANKFIPDLQKKFEDVLSFHNSMVENKVKFLQKGVEEDKVKLRGHSTERAGLLVEEAELVDKVNAFISLDEYNDLIFELNKKFEEKGRKEALLGEITDLKTTISTNEDRLKEINDILSSFETDLEEREAKFNEYFATVSDKLYKEKYFLSHDIVNSNFKFNVQDLQANKGGGKKKGEIASFDLAYIQFCNAENIPAPNFVLHDSPEDVSINQLVTLVEIANSINGQYIVSVLKDKFMSTIDAVAVIEDNKILELSSSDKLFKF